MVILSLASKKHATLPKGEENDKAIGAGCPAFKAGWGEVESSNIMHCLPIMGKERKDMSNGYEVGPSNFFQYNTQEGGNINAR